jgi:hypothetical protein
MSVICILLQITDIFTLYSYIHSDKSSSTEILNVTLFRRKYEEW